MFRKPKSDGEDTPPPSRRVRALADQLHEARDVHRLSTDPMLGAVTADRFRASITRTMWVFLAIGLGFTTTGVHDFLAGDRPITDPLWWGAWLAEPALAGILVTLLRWEASMLSHGVTVDVRPVRYLKRLLLGATLVANVWAGLAPAHGAVSKGMVFFHLVIPLVVFLLAEVMPVIQQTCTRVREQALATGPAPASTNTVRQAAASPVTMPAEIQTPRPSGVSGTLAKLPASIRTTVTGITETAHDAGRPVTAADLTARVNLPDAMLATLVDELNASINHHPVTA
ncbi:hypothetical protein [Amycolatopsis azurea]|uniref:DUF2637 domain-containing protein n=1 Tax=Amycolatopsis azurea DSM 43854 TaxID=1238180 RepID=M2PS37_9PSEU|nr:hypothetical protein [Amycolatopsis azurea]EMD27388.1 hypothetical protein C791_2400 [Amycolatopsis azurea DSM 43854]OOC03790.1 hypothetical protein B0293_26375 [Amycolatopsis azurea DSM 43854]